MIEIGHCKQIDLNLPRREVLNLSHLRPGFAIECKEGVLWVTCAGDTNDYTLVSGDKYIARDSHSVVVEAVKDAVVELKDQSGEFTIRTTD